MLIKIRDAVTEANQAVIDMRYVKSQVEDRIKQAPAAGVAELTSEGGKLKTNVTGVEAEVYQIKNQSGQDPLNYPIKLNNKLAALIGVVGSAPGRPTAQAGQVFGELKTKLNVQTTKMNKIWAEDLKRYNELLKKYGLQPIDPKPKPKTTA
jgi:hypothetical protein